MDAPMEMELCKSLQVIFQQITRFIESDFPNVLVEKVAESLKFLTESLKCQEARDTMTDTQFEVLIEVLNRLNPNMPSLMEEQRCVCLTECYRSLRNACAGCQSNQNILCHNEKCLRFTQCIIQKYTRHETEEISDDSQMVLLRCIVQFLGNLVVGHSENQTVVWNTFISCFRNMVNYGDSKLTNYTCMVIHTCLSEVKGQNIDTITDVEQLYHLTKSVIRYLTEEDFEWGLFVIQDVLQIGGFLEKIYTDLNHEEKVLVLEVIIDELKNLEDDKHSNDQAPALSNLTCLVQEVKSNAYRVLALGHFDVEHNMNPAVTVKELETLCLATSYHNLYLQLKEDSDLITCCVYLLQGIHQIGKEGDNQFTSVTKASEAHRVDIEHPSYGLKRDLIRLIGNLSYKTKKNQDKVRELNGIPLVLDLTNIDRKNPYITQWSVFAIHNLCEDNPQNKAILSELKLQGLDDNVNILRDYGVDAEIRGDKIHVKPSEPK